MKKILLVSASIALFVGCDFLPTSQRNEAEAHKESQNDRVQQMQKRKEAEIEWLNKNKETAKNTVKEFAEKKGYLIQKIEYMGGSYFGGTKGNFSFTITTGDTSQTGGLIWIISRVEREGSDWTVTYFAPRTD